jgi:molecular chaperone GrpE
VTEKPRGSGAAKARPAPGADASAGKPAGDPPAERVVIRDNRKIDHSDGKGKPSAGEPPAAPKDEQAGVEQAATDTTALKEPEQPAPSTPDGGADPTADAETESAGPAGAVTEAEGAPGDEPAAEGEAAPGPGAGPLGAELEALRAELEERTRDLQRVSAEYANYRKRVDRDRGLAAEQTIGQVLSALLPVLDDLDRAREHGDLVGPFGAVAEQLTGTLAKFGLTAFGEKGDPFDPTRHEAVTHLRSAEVTEPSCVDVMRRGYLLGDRLLRPALVAVADPE